MASDRIENPVSTLRDLTGNPRWFWGLLIATTLWRILAALRLDLSLDEGYYHYWSLFPQLSYFDHPPFTAWSMSLLGHLFGNSLWTVRFWPVVTAAAFALTGRALAGRMFENAETGNRAGLLLLLTPAFAGNGLIMTPDTFMALFWAGALYCTSRAVPPGGSFAWWIATGVCAGLGLLTKYNMILFFLGLGLFWLLAPGLRLRIFLGAVTAGVIALLIFSPVLIWNYQHDWISFRFQLSHGFAKNAQSATDNLAYYLGGLLLLATPLLGGLCFWSCGKGIAAPQQQRRFLAAFFWIVVLFFGYSSIKAAGQMNWAMLAFFSGILLVAHDWPGFARGWRCATLVLLMTADALLMVYALLPTQLPLGARWLALDRRRTREFFGAERIAQAVQAKFKESGADFLCATSHQTFGRLSFYAPELRGVLWQPQAGRYRYPWINDSQWAGKTALWAAQKQHKADILKYFQEVTELGTVEVPSNAAHKETLYFYLARGYRPESAPTAPIPAVLEK